MFFKKNILHIFSFFCISTLISCANFYTKESKSHEKNVMTGKIMKDNSSLDIKTNLIKLYIYPHCMYCKKVINYLRTNNYINKITIVDVTNKANMQELLTINNGNTQCPFLYDQEKNIKMLESDDIIKYFSTHF